MNNPNILNSTINSNQFGTLNHNRTLNNSRNSNTTGSIGPGALSLSLSNQQQHGGSLISGIGTLSRNATPYRQYPPDLLAFSGGRNNSSPTSQASTIPDSTRLSNQQQQQPQILMRPSYPNSPSSPAASLLLGYSPTAAFKTLPHPPRSSSVTPYSYGHHPYSQQQQQQHHVIPGMPRHMGNGIYDTMPRRPRAPSWSSSCPPISPNEHGNYKLKINLSLNK